MTSFDRARALSLCVMFSASVSTQCKCKPRANAALPTVEIIALDQTSIGAGAVATLQWRSNVASEYVALAAPAAGGDATILARGNVGAAAINATPVPGDRLTLGENVISVVVLAPPSARASVDIVKTRTTYAVGGSVVGLAGTLGLKSADGQSLTLDAGASTFAFAGFADGAAYAVTASSQPTAPRQTCVVAGGAGVVAGAAVTSIVVTCTTETFAVRGSVSGLSGTGLALADGSTPLPLTGSAFSLALSDGDAYAIGVAAQPVNPRQTCTINGGQGHISGQDVVISVSCVTNPYLLTGSASGVVGAGLVLQNGTDMLPIAADGPFAFATQVLDGAPYAVVIQSVPSNQVCALSGAAGTLGPTTSVVVTCRSLYTLRGTLSGLGAGTLVLSDGVESINVSSASFSFPTKIADGDAFSVFVVSQPAGQTCTLSGASGNVTHADPSVSVTCSNNVVTALYPLHGNLWNDYVKNGSDVACNATTDGPDYLACQHGGALRTFSVVGQSACAGLSAQDSAGAFAWTCVAGSPVKMVSTGLNAQRGLTDLIDFSPPRPAWKALSVTVRNGGGPVYTTPSEIWWANPVLLAPAAGSLLLTPSAIYVVTTSTSPVARYRFGASHEALLIAPGVLLPWDGSTNNVVFTQDYDFLWLEGAIDATTAFYGVWVSNVRFSVLRNLKVSGGTVAVDLNVGATKNLVVGLRTANASSAGLEMHGAVANRIYDASFENGSDGLYTLLGADGNVFDGVRSFNNTGEAVHLTTNNNVLTQTVVANNSFNTRFDAASSNWLAGLSVASVSAAVSNVRLFADASANGSNDNTLMSVASVNSAFNGIWVDGSSNNLFCDVAAANVATAVKLSNATSNTFTGVLKDNSTSFQHCSVTGGSAPGLIDQHCADSYAYAASTYAGQTSDAVLVIGIDASASFVGKVTLDASNQSAPAGSAAYAAISDWFHFDDAFRGWGKDGLSAFPNAAYQDACKTGQCRIWDFSLKSGDLGDPGPAAGTGDDRAVFLGTTSALPTGNDVLTHTWAAATALACAAIPGAAWVGPPCQSAYLRHASELYDDGVGNDNGLCEANEVCLFLGNIGAYQGHGILAPTGAVTSGTLSGIQLMSYGTNGY